MALESVTYIGDLDPINPTGSDPKSQGDDHIRNIKEALRNGFPGFTGSVIIAGSDVGTVNACALAPATPLPAYVVNTMVVFRPSAANTIGTPTMNISGLGVRNIRAVDGGALRSGDLRPDQYVAMIYNGSEFRLVGVTKNYVDGLAFQSALPTPPAGPGPFYLSYRNGAFGYSTTAFPDFLLQANGVI